MFLDQAARLAMRARIAIAKSHAPGLTVGRDVFLQPQARIYAGASERVVIGDRTRIYGHVIVMPERGSVEIGADCSISPYSVLYGHGGLRIGDGTMIGAHSVLTPQNHIFEDLPTPLRRQGETKVGITLGHDVWLGAHVVVCDGVTIGDHAVVGAGAVVTRDVEPATVVAGVPARLLRRFGP